MAQRSRLTDKVTFDIFLGDGEVATGRQFPPHRFYTRDQRLQDLENLWLGKFDNFLDTTNDGVQVINVNYFHSYSTKLANLLLMSEPEGIGADVLYDALIDMSRFGGCIIRDMDGEYDVGDPLTWYPASDGSHYFVVPVISDKAETPMPDQVEVWHFVDQRYEMNLYSYQHNRIGGDLGVKESGTGDMIVVPRKPTIGDMWGNAKYLEIFGPCLEISNRANRNSRVLDLNGRPIPVMTISDADAEERFNIDVDNDSNEEVMRKIEQGGLDINKQETIHLPNDVRDFKFEQPNVDGVNVALAQIDTMQKMISQLTGLPSLSGEYQPPSGEALKRELLPFYAETSAMQNDLIEALEELNVTVVWDHVFDVLEREDLDRSGRSGLGGGENEFVTPSVRNT